MRWGMVIDLSKCVRCYACIAACRVEHFLPMGVTWPRLVALETNHGSPEVSTYRLPLPEPHLPF
jgi:Fe-S-cluster-containing dehydrogenase component